MPSTAAQDEFDALFNSTKEDSLPHPEDLAADDRSIHSSHSSTTAAGADSTERKTLRSTTNPDSDHEDSDQEARTKSDKMRTRYYIPSTRSEANTGPKGVIADAQAFEQARRAHRGALPRSHRKYMPTPPPTASSTSSNPAQSYSHSQSHLKMSSSSHARAGSWLMEPDDEDDSDDDFLSRWRQSRLQELSKTHTKPGYAGRRSTSAPRYGTVQNVDASGYLDAIELARKDAIVIVFIFDDMSDVSTLIEHCVHNVARAYPSIRFVKMHYEQALMEPAGVPAILAYRNGDKFADMVPVLDEIPEEDELSSDSLAFAMKRKGMLA